MAPFQPTTSQSITRSFPASRPSYLPPPQPRGTKSHGRPPTCSVPQPRGTEPSKLPQRGSVPYHTHPHDAETPESQHPPKTQRPVVRYGTPKTPFPAFRTTPTRYGIPKTRLQTFRTTTVGYKTVQNPSTGFRTVPQPRGTKPIGQDQDHSMPQSHGRAIPSRRRTASERFDLLLHNHAGATEPLKIKAPPHRHDYWTIRWPSSSDDGHPRSDAMAAAATTQRHAAARNQQDRKSVV